MVTFDPEHYPYFSRRNVVYARRAMACTSVPQGAQIGLDVMKAGDVYKRQERCAGWAENCRRHRKAQRSIKSRKKCALQSAVDRHLCRRLI